MACPRRGHRHAAWRAMVLLACTPELPDALLPLYWRHRCVSLATPCPPASASARPAASSRSEALCLLCMLCWLAKTASLSLLLLHATGEGVSAAEACSTDVNLPTGRIRACKSRRARALSVSISPSHLRPGARPQRALARLAPSSASFQPVFCLLPAAPLLPAIAMYPC